MNEIYELIKKQKLPEGTKSLILSMACDDLDGNNADTPLVKYFF